MKKKEVRFGIPNPPRVVNTKSVLLDADDHLGKSTIMVDTWWSG